MKNYALIFFTLFTLFTLPLEGRAEIVWSKQSKIGITPKYLFDNFNIDEVSPSLDYIQRMLRLYSNENQNRYRDNSRLTREINITTMVYEKPQRLLARMLGVPQENLIYLGKKRLTISRVQTFSGRSIDIVVQIKREIDRVTKQRSELYSCANSKVFIYSEDTFVNFEGCEQIL